MIKWLLIALIFNGTEVLDSKIGGATTEAECKAAQARLAEMVKDEPVQLWTVCVEMTHKPKIVVKPDTVN